MRAMHLTWRLYFMGSASYKTNTAALREPAYRNKRSPMHYSHNAWDVKYAVPPSLLTALTRADKASRLPVTQVMRTGLGSLKVSFQMLPARIFSAQHIKIFHLICRHPSLLHFTTYSSRHRVIYI